MNNKKSYYHSDPSENGCSSSFRKMERVAVLKDSLSFFRCSVSKFPKHPANNAKSNLPLLAILILKGPKNKDLSVSHTKKKRRILGTKSSGEGHTDST